MVLPAEFASPLDLPFNRTCLEGRFLHQSPLAATAGDPCWVLLRGTELVLQAAGDALVLPRGPLPATLLAETAVPLPIGLWDGSPCLALTLPREQVLPAGFSTVNLLATEPALSIELLTLGGCAGQMLHWDKTSRHCSLCGGDLSWLTGDWGKRCASCGYSHYPHIHPCVIVLVRRPGEVLLARKAEWPAGRYSLVAGFVDFGEALEEAVAREVLEETGVRVKNLRYLGSQCWPFPSQLMAAFVADYDGGEVQVEEAELEDVRWFALDALPQLPPRRSIARFVLDRFARDR